MDAHSTLLNRIVRSLAWSCLFCIFLASTVVLGQFIGIPSDWASLLGIAGVLAAIFLSSLKRTALIGLALSIAAATGYLLQTPSHDREWIPSIARLPQTRIDGDILTVGNLRDFNWRSTTDFDERWIQESYDLRRLTGLEAIVVPFGDSELAAHVMLSFGFDDGRHLAISVESRPEQGESYSLIGGATRQLELIYLFGTERDLLGLRILHRGDRVYSFPLRTGADFARGLLLELCESANRLRDKPKFYATLRHNCTTTLLRHVNKVRNERIAFQKEILFPAQLGKLLHSLERLDTRLDWPEAKMAFRVDETIKQASDLSNFSRTLRSQRKAASH